MWNGTMFVDLDWPLNASSLLSASAELLVAFLPPPIVGPASRLHYRLALYAWWKPRFL